MKTYFTTCLRHRGPTLRHERGTISIFYDTLRVLRSYFRTGQGYCSPILRQGRILRGFQPGFQRSTDNVCWWKKTNVTSLFQWYFTLFEIISLKGFLFYLTTGWVSLITWPPWRQISNWINTCFYDMLRKATSIYKSYTIFSLMKGNPLRNMQYN